MGSAASQEALLSPSQENILRKIEAFRRARPGTGVSAASTSDSSPISLGDTELAKYLSSAEQIQQQLMRDFSLSSCCSDASFEKESETDDNESTAKQVMRVRLVISTSTNLSGFMLRGASAVANTEYGIVHSALVLGNTLVDWVDSSLCIPRQLKTRRAMMVINLGSLDVNLGENKQRLAQVGDKIVEWNASKKYSRTGANCQHFVLEILELLGMPRRLPGQLGSFMDEIKRGNHQLVFRDPLAAGMEQTFATHAALDTYVEDLLQRVAIENGRDPGTTDLISLFQKLYPGDWELLVAFDRAFWAIYATNLSDTDSKPRCKTVDGHEKEACPIELSSVTREMLNLAHYQ